MHENRETTQTNQSDVRLEDLHEPSTQSY